MREFTREMHGDVRVVNRRFVAASALGAALAGVAVIFGLALMAGYDPLVQQLTVMGLPRVAAPILGIVEIAAAVALLFPTTGFVAAAWLGVIDGLLAVAYLRMGENGFAMVAAGVGALYFLDMVVRTPEVLVEGRRLWMHVKPLAPRVRI